ncbi:hypothetical protein [Flavobacterium sp. XS2P14]|uniref:hypothetical protein n=1 Tax=Flavobacterium sp. XS2P14 TaxID=3401735 RepID=UPI003AAE0F3A
MTISEIIVSSITVSIALVIQQIVKTFGRDTSVIDREAVDVILSNSSNKKKLIERLNKNVNSSVEVKIEGNDFTFVTSE